MLHIAQVSSLKAAGRPELWQIIKIQPRTGDYRRVFSKKCVKNWGTRERPGLTLNLQKFDAGAGV